MQRLLPIFALALSLLLADETIRRLRFWGWHFERNRIANPYEPYGEVCGVAK